MNVATRPVAYLDVDDVLIQWKGRHRMAAPHAANFLQFLREHFEVRWITSWCPSGEMSEDRLLTLAELLQVEPEVLRWIRNPRSFPGKPHGYPPKHYAIDFGDSRPWVWIEDEHLHKSNLDELARRGVRDRYVECNVSWRPDDLLRVRTLLEDRFRLPTNPA